MASQEALFTVPLFINGKEHRPPASFDVVSPVTRKPAHRCISASVHDAAAAVDAAAGAFTSWKRTTPSHRRDIFFKATEIIDSRRDHLIRCLMDETGATHGWGDFILGLTIELLKDVAGRITTIEGTFPTLVDPETSAIVLREPYGVVLAVAPWNAPFILGVRSFASPIAAGNTVVVKASELAPRSIWAMVSAMHEAGLPDGVLNMIVHEPSAAAKVTAAVIANPLVKKINFTGSTHVGRIVAKLAGEQLKPVVLELGGKAPAIVWEDADLQLAADKCALGAFQNAGQVCMSTEYILVHKSVKQPFVEKFTAAVARHFPSGAEAPLLISSAAVAKNKRLVADAADRGASVLHGDVNSRETSETRLRPIVLEKVTSDMDIHKTESFGPTVSLIEIDSEEQAIQIANDSKFGLTSAVFTKDLRRGLRLAREIETGAVHINGMTIHDEPALPHGGVKASGYGRWNSSRGMEEWVRTKNVTFTI